MRRRVIGLLPIATLVATACTGSNASAPSQLASATKTPERSAVVTDSPTSLVTPSPAPPETASTFTSPLYDYTISVPAGWHSAAAIIPWDGASAPGSEDPAVDKLAGPGATSAFVFAGPTSVKLDEFVEDTIKWSVRDHGDTCTEHTPEARESIAIGGQAGIYLAWNCGILINHALTVHHGMAFTLVMRDPGVPGATDPTDRALLQELIDSVVFRT